uniref:BZIP domain-containing protein n=1 Tax=Caenorhabditis tropicalis TaxID=1561998 RepID=A0A1I7UXV3_9PELO
MAIQELQEKIKSLTSAASAQASSSKHTIPFSFVMADSRESGIALTTSMANSSPNSTFNLVSPLVNSPAQSLNSSNFHAFFESETTPSTVTEGFNDDLMFNTASSGQSVIANTSNSSAFSIAFNNMFTPTRSTNTSKFVTDHATVNQTVLDKTSASLDNWKLRESSSFETHDISKRDSSLPTGIAAQSSSHLHYAHKNSRFAPPSKQSVTGLDRQKVRDMRRISSQPGYLARRKSINNNRSSFLMQGE